MSDTVTMPGGPPPLQIGMLLYPGLTMLDLVGPQTALGPHSQTHLVWETTDPIRNDAGYEVVPTATFDDAPQDLDLLFVPGGQGTYDVLSNERAMDWVRSRGHRAKYVTSVCSGSIILAAAGLLDGYKAATHWACYDILQEFDVTGVHDRVVTDRNRITGGGVTAGIDFGLTVLAQLRGEMVAKATQLMIEYDPEPPFDTGSPEKAGPEIYAMVSGMLEPLNQQGLAAARAFKERRRIAA
jgi:cyclohexyl-isocyanide hydratase